MHAAAAVRRAAGDQPTSSELSLALEQVEQTLHDLSEGMARMSGVIGEQDTASGGQDTASGGLAWRLQTLRHALQAARHVCSRARSIVPRSGIGGGRSMVEADEPSAA